MGREGQPGAPNGEREIKNQGGVVTSSTRPSGTIVPQPDWAGGGAKGCDFNESATGSGEVSTTDVVHLIAAAALPGKLTGRPVPAGPWGPGESQRNAADAVAIIGEVAQR